ncbi:MAG: HAD family phosphatase [Clostridia bacterium]|nr:HAD family phosphatase [Clostridia bacterium]
MNIKLVCMDLDGTLFAHAGEIPDVNIKALRECEKRGIRLALVSGRGFPFIRRTAERIGVDCAIVSANGARIEASANGPLVFEGTFTEDEGRRVMDTMLEAEVNFEAYTREVNYVVHPELAPERHIRSLQMNVQAGDVKAEYDPEKMKRYAPSTAYKFVVFTKDEDAFQRARKLLDQKGIKHCSSGSGNLEVMPRGIDKGSAIRRLWEHFGLKKDQVMAFGDYTNDLDMLMASGHPVAMGNAVEEVRAIAKYIAPVNTEGGVGLFLMENVLQEKMLCR